MGRYFSVVIPLYNKQAHIQRAVNSVLEQTCQDFEIIVVDDGSTDQSVDKVKQLQASRTDQKLQLYSQQNSGVAVARNTGIEHANGHFIAFLDADDSYQPIFLSEIHALTERYPDAALFCTAYQFVGAVPGAAAQVANIQYESTATKGLLANYFVTASCGDLPVTSSSVCIKKDVLEEINGFPGGESMGEDQSVWSEVALRYPIAYSQHIGANYYQDSDNRLMNHVPPQGEMPFSQRLQQYLNQGDVPTRMIDGVQAYIAAHLLDLIRRNYQSDNIQQCRRLLRDPRTRKQWLRWCYWRLKTVVKFID